MPVPRVPRNKARARVLWRAARTLRGESQTARLYRRSTEADVLNEAADLVEWLARAEWSDELPGQLTLDDLD